MRSRISKFYVVASALSALAIKEVGIRFNVANGYDIALPKVASLFELHLGLIKHYGLIGSVPSMFLVANIVLCGYFQQVLVGMNSTLDRLFPSNIVKNEPIGLMCDIQGIEMVYNQEADFLQANAIEILKVWFHNIVCTVVEAVDCPISSGAIDQNSFKKISISHCCFIIGPQQKNLGNVQKINSDTKAELIKMVQKQFVFFLRSGREQQWDPGGYLSTFASASWSPFKEWDPGKFGSMSKFYNLEDKVDLEGVGNDRIFEDKRIIIILVYSRRYLLGIFY